MGLNLPSVGAANASGVVLVVNPPAAPEGTTFSGGHTLYSMSATAGETAGIMIALDAEAVPASGAALTGIHQAQAVAAGATENITLGVPDDFATGIVLVFSSSTTTFTPVVAAWLGGQAQ
jgi:hypothetical protein